MQATRKALVTGAASGIGRVIALDLASRGMSIVAIDRDEKGLLSLEQKIKGRGGHARTFAMDFAEADAATRLQALPDHVPDVDVLINNAGVGLGVIRPNYHTEPINFWDVEAAQWSAVMAINTTPTFLLARAYVPGMLRRGWGRVVTVTTSLGSMLRRGYVPYGPSKAALEALTACISKDVDGKGVTSNVLIPGGITNTGLVPDGAFERDQLLQPEIMLAPLAFLLSDDGAAVNGRRFVAAHWVDDESRGAIEGTWGQPIGWEAIATMPIGPTGGARAV
jgi:NAD(P)-dependent dehydrogenase (short-subunit alcohol dehydrogenase family)